MLGVLNVRADDQRTVSAVSSDSGWNAVFDRTDGWTGADAAGSVDLGDGRTLWLFGDTWISKIRDGKRLPGARDGQQLNCRAPNQPSRTLAAA